MYLVSEVSRCMWEGYIVIQKSKSEMNVCGYVVISDGKSFFPSTLDLNPSIKKLKPGPQQIEDSPVNSPKQCGHLT